MGKVPKIMGLVSEITSDSFRIQIGLKMRGKKLCNNLLFSGEAWSLRHVENGNQNVLKNLLSFFTAMWCVG